MHISMLIALASMLFVSVSPVPVQDTIPDFSDKTQWRVFSAAVNSTTFLFEGQSIVCFWGTSLIYKHVHITDIIGLEMFSLTDPHVPFYRSLVDHSDTTIMHLVRINGKDTIFTQPNLQVRIKGSINMTTPGHTSVTFMLERKNDSSVLTEIPLSGVYRYGYPHPPVPGQDQPPFLSPSPSPSPPPEPMPHPVRKQRSI